MSLETLGASLSLTQAAMSKIELGESKIDADLLPRVAELLGVSTAAFFSEEPIKKLPPAVEQAAQRAADLAVQAARSAIRDEVRAVLREELGDELRAFLEIERGRRERRQEQEGGADERGMAS